MIVLGTSAFLSFLFDYLAELRLLEFLFLSMGIPLSVDYRGDPARCPLFGKVFGL